MYLFVLENNFTNSASLIVETNISNYHFTERGQNILTKEKLLAIGDTYEANIAHNKQQDSEFR